MADAATATATIATATTAARALAPLLVTPLSTVLGARIDGINLADELAQPVVDAIRAAWLRHGVLLFRGQQLSHAQQIAFTRRLGEPVVYTRSENASPQHPELLVLSNAIVDGRRIGAAISGRYWHTDGHFLAQPPAGTLLYASQVPPEGGDTWFVNMTLAYQALPDDLRAQVDGREFVMDRVQTLRYHYPERAAPPPDQKRAWPDIAQPLVRTHPETGVDALYIGAAVPWRIVGMDEDQSNAVMARLHAIAFDEERHGWCHQWQAGDVLLWDNRCLAHRATGYDMARYQRTLYRTTIAGDKPFWKPRGAQRSATAPSPGAMAS